LGTNLYQKNYYYWRFWAASQHFLSHNSKIWSEPADLGLPPHAKFCKNGLRANLYPKLPIIAILSSLAHFYNNNGEIWRKNADQGHPPRANFCKTRLRANLPIFVSPHFWSHNGEVWRDGADL